MLWDIYIYIYRYIYTGYIYILCDGIYINRSSGRIRILCNIKVRPVTQNGSDSQQRQRQTFRYKAVAGPAVTA